VAMHRCPERAIAYSWAKVIGSTNATSNAPRPELTATHPAATTVATSTRHRRRRGR
jgi:hypothetical protein